MPFFRRFTPTPETEALLPKLTAEQNQLRDQLKLQPLPHPPQLIAGCDSAFIGEQILSVFVVFSFPELLELEMQYHVSSVAVPYVPGYLAFREVPNLLKTFAKLKHTPDLIRVDGHGIMHPRRMGIAAHLGVKLGLPTIGIAKKKLVGKYQEPGLTKGSESPVIHHEEVVGLALRSKENVKPIFVSPGHLCDLETAINLTLQTLRQHKLPEPTRIADRYSKELKGTAATGTQSNQLDLL
jgi:deoxyribonuclease V